MLLNYLKLALRLLTRNPFFTAINVTGLSIGFATFLLLFPFAESELRSDQYRKGADRIGRLSIDFKWTDDNRNWNGWLAAFNYYGVAHQIKNTVPGVEEISCIMPQAFFDKDLSGFDKDFFVSIISDKETRSSFRETKAVIGDPNILRFFSIPLIEGDTNDVLKAPNTVILSQKTAKKYFGDESALNKTIYVNDTLPMKVQGVFADLPYNSHLQFDLVFTSVSYHNIEGKSWNGWTGYCYMKVASSARLEALALELEGMQGALYDFVKIPCPQCDLKVYLQPLGVIPFSNLQNNYFKSKSEYILKAFIIVSFVVLILAWINYVALSVHSLQKRLPEIGARKVNGASLKDFVLQFFVESALINLGSIIIAVALIQLVRQPAEVLLQFHLPLWSDFGANTFIIIFATICSGIIFVGVYPVAIIFRKKPHHLFKKLNVHDGFGYSFGSILVTVQYAAAIALLVWIAAVYFQLNYIFDKDLGISKEGIIVVEAPLHKNRDYRNNVSSFLNLLRSTPGVYNATQSNTVLGDGSGLEHSMSVRLNEGSNFIGVDTNGGVDDKFLETYNIKLLAGRNFMKDNPADQRSILLSRALTMRLGFKSPADAIGKRIIVSGRRDIEVIGIFSDYEFRPFYNSQTERDRGVGLTYGNSIVPYEVNKFSVSVNLKDFKRVLTSIEMHYKKIFPEEQFNWAFLEEKLASRYSDDEIAKNQITLFSLLALGIACLGLLGMVSNKVVERTKEIGIRKVLGAELHHIARLLLNTTAWQLAIAIVLGVFLANYLSQQYLEKFSDRIELQWWHFALPIVSIIVVMIVAVTPTLWKSSNANPIDSIRYE